jgi:hypothetical protein
MEYFGDENVVAFVKKHADELIKKTNLANAPTFVKDTIGNAVIAEDLHLTVRLQKI